MIPFVTTRYLILNDLPQSTIFLDRLSYQSFNNDALADKASRKLGPHTLPT